MSVPIPPSTTPVWAGEISAPNLGVGLEAWNADGRPVIGEVGELVVTKPMPSMPAIIEAGGEAPATMHDTSWSMPRFCSAGALISMEWTTGAPQ